MPSTSRRAHKTVDEVKAARGAGIKYGVLYGVCSLDPAWLGTHKSER